MVNIFTQNARWALVMGLILSGCARPDFSQAGIACSSTEGCTAGQVCYEGRCVLPAADWDGGPAKAAPLDAGAPEDAGSDAGVDAGPVTEPARCADGAAEGGPEVFGRSDMVFCGATHHNNHAMPATKAEAAALCGEGSHLCSALEYRARNDDCTLAVSNLGGWLSAGDDCVVRIRPRDFSTCQADGTRTSEFGDPSSGSCPEDYSGGEWGLESAAAEDLLDFSCSDNSLGCGAFCCVNGPAAGDGSSSEAPALTCADVFGRVPEAESGSYWIDPDGVGGVAPTLVHCDVGPNAWMTVANIRDTDADDVPNTPTAMYKGWHKDDRGIWPGPGSALVAQVHSETAVVGFDFVVAAQAHGYTELKMSFYNSEGELQAWRSTVGGDANALILESPGSPNLNPAQGSYLNSYRFSPLLYAFGRLIGVPGSGDSFAALGNGVQCVRRGGSDRFFGEDVSGRYHLCEHSLGRGAWHGWGYGCIYSPPDGASDEISGCLADQFVLELGRP